VYVAQRAALDAIGADVGAHEKIFADNFNRLFATEP
jgi:hypothetical protein